RRLTRWFRCITEGTIVLAMPNRGSNLFNYVTNFLIRNNTIVSPSIKKQFISTFWWHTNILGAIMYNYVTNFVCSLIKNITYKIPFNPFSGKQVHKGCKEIHESIFLKQKIDTILVDFFSHIIYRWLLAGIHTSLFNKQRAFRTVFKFICQNM
ncbi:hypothetical protein ACJX0J_007563, partial [Zea mays]